MLEKLKENKKIVRNVLIGILVFLFVTVLILVGKEIYRSQTEKQEQTEYEETLTEEQKVQMELTNEQKTIIENYDNETKEFIAILESAVWCDSEGKNFIRFFENYFTDSNKSSDGQANTDGILFVINKLKKDSFIQNGASAVRWTAVVSTKEADTQFLTMTEVTQKNTGGTTTKDYTINSDLFSSKSDYTKVQTADYLEIEGLTEEALSYFGNDKDVLEQTLKDYMGMNYPYVTKLRYSGIVSVCTGENLNYTTFITSSSTNTKTITVAYNTNDKTFKVMEGQNNVTSQH